MSVSIEVWGMRFHGHHGVLEEERREGRRFAVDVTLELLDEPTEDRIEAAVDYREIARCVEEEFEGQQFQLLETLGAAIADALLARFPVRSAWVRIGKELPSFRAGGRPRVIVERSRGASGRAGHSRR